MAGEKTDVLRPHRAIEVEIRVGADNWPEAERQIAWVLGHIMEHGTACNSVSGSPSSNHSVNVELRPEMTHEKYMESLENYLRAIKGGFKGSSA